MGCCKGCCGTCCTCTTKYLLFFFNLIFALVGAVLAVVSGIVHYNGDYYEEYLGRYVGLPSFVIFIVGCIIFLVSFFGCFGAIRESQCMLITFSVLLGLLAVAQLAGASLLFVYVARVDGFVRSAATDLLRVYGAEGPDGDIARRTWDRLQNTYQCCGVDGPDDWLAAPPEGPGLEAPPESCSCDYVGLSCQNNVNVEGCHEPLANLYRVVMYSVAGAAVAVAAIQVVGIIMSCIFASSIKSKKKHRMKV